MDIAKNEKQLFVRNLSYQTTGEDLAALFQEFGPLKHTSVVQENGVSKGFGFVKFALEADTATALEKLQGHQLHGRRIKLELGVKKDKHTKKDDSTTVDKQVIVTEATEASTKQKSDKKEKKIAEKKDKAESDGADVADGEAVEGGEENAAAVKKSRQILVMGVPVDVNKKAFKSALAKISRKADVELIKEENELSASLYIINPPGKIMLVTGSSRQEAAKLLAALNNATVHNLELRKFLPVDKTATPEETAALVAKGRKEKLVARTLADMTEIEFRKRKCRVILRNLSFQSTEQNVLDKMSKFGPLVSVEIPRTVIEKSNSNRRKGREDKAEGEEVLGDNQVLRPKGFGFVTFLCEKDAKAAVEGSAGLRVCNREVAIDFCMNKESYEKYGKTTDEGAAEAENEEGETDAAEESVKEGDEERDDDDEDAESADGDAAGGEEGDAQQQEEEEESEVEKEKKEDVQEGCTVFIRGLPFDAEPSDIKSAMRQFGRITLAIVVKDKLTGISKGSAFVKFSNTDEVAACLAEAALNSGLTIKDRVCKVNAAVDRESAQKLKVEDRQGKDKRNLYLANEGLVVPKDSDKTKKGGDMSEADKEKRQRAQNEKRKKLQNPLFFVSGNRVSVRNLGKNVTDHDLKVACLKAVKASLEKGLVTTEDLENHMKAQGAATSVTTDIPPFVTKTCVKSAKVMLDLTRVRGGVPQSRGYGFVEFLHHAHALGCLREMNNSSKYSDIATSSVNGVETTGGKGKLILEFSLENIQKVKILRDREVRQKQHNAPSSAAAPKDKAKTAAVEAAADSKSGNKQKDKKSNKQSESTAVVASPPSAHSSNKKNKRSAEQDGSVAADAQEPPKKKANKPDAVAAKESTPIAEAAPKPVAQKKEVVAAKATEVGSVSVASGSGEAVSSSSAAEDAKKALKKENRKKRKLEDKLVRRETAFQAKKEAKQQQTAEGVSNGAPSTKKARVETSVTTATTEQPAKLHKLLRPKLDKKERAAAAEKKKKEAAAEETQKRPWGGHKRMRAEKLKKMGAAKKK